MDAESRVPVQLTSFVGRESEATALERALAEVRLVTLVGAPGCGKTRLAGEVGKRLVDAHPGGVSFVDLTHITEPTRVPDLFAATLGIREQPGRRITDALTRALRDSPPRLIVVDNCEHVLEPTAVLVTRLLVECPALTVLATSRTLLAVDGEQIWAVPPLDPAAAAELFVDRARLARHDFPAEANRPGIEQVCRRLDGLPLAIELAAAWTRVLSIRQISERLEQADGVLTRLGLAPTDRHATMTGTIERTHQLLPTDAQRLYARLAVFAGGFDLDAATAVSNPGDDPLRSLATLVDHSLVTIISAHGDEPRRFRLLEPIRHHAAAKLAENGEVEVVHRRHAEHFLTSAQRYQPLLVPDVVRGLPHQQLRGDAANFRVALDWARTQPSDLGLRLTLHLWTFWVFGGHITEGRSRIEDRLAHGTTDPQLHIAALTCAGQLAWRQRDHITARTHLERARAEIGLVNDPALATEVLLSLSYLEQATGNLQEAVALGEAAERTARLSGNQSLLALALNAKGWAHYAAEEIAAGYETHQEMLDILQRRVNDTGVAMARFGLQYGAFLRGDPTAQRGHIREALASLQRGGTIERSDLIGSCALLAATEGRYRTALRLLAAAERLGQDAGATIPPHFEAQATARVEPLYPKISDAELRHLWAEGRAMSWDEIVSQTLAEPGAKEHALLTPRESEVVELVAQGLSNVDIARRLTISRRTVESHIDHILRKLALTSRYEIMAWVHGAQSPVPSATRSERFFT